jgi:hypothetical protein
MKIEPEWPKEDPLTRRWVCEMCYNQVHKKCGQKSENILKPECHCACLDPKPRRVKKEKPDTLDIGEVYGNIEV